MTQKPREGDFGELKSKHFPSNHRPQTSLEVGNRSVLILDPRLISIHFATESFLLWYVLFYSKPAQSVCLLARTI